MKRAAAASIACIAAFAFLFPILNAGASEHQAKASGEVQQQDSLQKMKALAAKGDVDGLYIESASVKPESLHGADRESAAAILLDAAEMHSSDAAMALGLAEIALKFSKNKRGYVTAAEMAAALGDLSLAGTYFDEALKISPEDDALKIKRAAAAAVARDWNTAESVYRSVPESSSFHQAAEAGLKQLADDMAAAERESVERAHRDLLRRVAEADSMIDAMPVSEFDYCRAHTLAACEAVTACRKIHVNCTFLLESCPQSSRTVDIPRTELSKCADALAAVPCDKLEPSIPRYSSEICRGLLLRTTRALVPEEGENSGSVGDDKKKDNPAPGKGTSEGPSQLSPEEIEAAVKKIQQSGALGI